MNLQFSNSISSMSKNVPLFSISVAIPSANVSNVLEAIAVVNLLTFKWVTNANWQDADRTQIVPRKKPLASRSPEASAIAHVLQDSNLVRITSVLTLMSVPAVWDLLVEEVPLVPTLKDPSNVRVPLELLEMLTVEFANL